LASRLPIGGLKIKDLPLSERVQLASCEKVPFDLRRFTALAVYLYARVSEILQLRWSDINLEQGVAHIRRSYDGDRKQEKATKNKRPRGAALPPCDASGRALSGNLSSVPSGPSQVSRFASKAEPVASHSGQAGVSAGLRLTERGTLRRPPRDKIK
jgi:hypothetical protein